MCMYSFNLDLGIVIYFLPSGALSDKNNKREYGQLTYVNINQNEVHIQERVKRSRTLEVFIEKIQAIKK